MNNPAIGSWDDVFGGKSANVISIGEALKAMVCELHPGTVEVARPGDNAVSFGVGPKKMSEAYVYLAPLAERVNLGFYQGATLDDPDALMEGSGKALRHIKVTDLALAKHPTVKKLIAAAIKERSGALGRNI